MDRGRFLFERRRPMYENHNGSLYIREMLPPFLATEDPHQRLVQHGPEALHNGELLAVLLGLKIEVATRLLQKQTLAELISRSLGELTPPLTPRQARHLVAALELARRGLQKGLGVLPVISCPAETVPLLADIRDQRKEFFLCLYLNARNQLIHKEVVSIGSLSASIVHPREVFQAAVHHSAASIILAHNHPSGEVSPSKDDIELTGRLLKAGEIMGIEVLDHIIIGAADFLSLRERRFMENLS